MDRLLSTDEAAEELGVTKQAIYLAIHKNKIKVNRNSWHYTIRESDLEDYREHRFDRDRSTFDGEPLYDVEKGTYSLKKAAEYLGIEYSSLYHHVRMGRIKATRKRAAWIFTKDDLEALKAFLNNEIAAYINA